MALCLATAAEAAPCTVAAPVAPNAKTDVIYDPADSSMKACVAGNWVVLAAGGGGATNLAALSDVSLSSPALNNVLLFNGTSWVNSAVTVNENDPQVSTLTANKWCAANAFGTAIDCTQDAPSGGSSQWTDGTGGAIYYNGGNVGIGTSSPQNVLDVQKDGATIFVRDGDSANRFSAISMQTAGGAWYIANGLNSGASTNNNLHIMRGTNLTDPYLTITRDSRAIGIGTSSPQSALHVPDGKYAQFEDFNAGPPPGADCSADAHRGRQSIDATNFRLYICMGAARGWDFVALSD